MLVPNLIVHSPISGLLSWYQLPNLEALTSSLVLRNEAGSSDSQLRIRLRVPSLDLDLECRGSFLPNLTNVSSCLNMIGHQVHGKYRPARIYTSWSIG